MFNSAFNELLPLNITILQSKEWKRNSKIPKGQTEIVKSEDRQDHGQQNETKDKHRTHNTTLETKAGVTQTLQKQDRTFSYWGEKLALLKLQSGTYCEIRNFIQFF